MRAAVYHTIFEGMQIMPIYVMFRFDTEDFVTPESNDALRAVAEALTERGMRATFPMVGEKARFIRRQGRDDVVRALQPHALGFHTHWHSAHPTLPERVEGLSWNEGISALDEAERPGVDAVADVFGRHPCAYTQAGGTWLPHSHTLAQSWGMPFFYTETWNSYLDVVGRPYRMGTTPGLTSPVTFMRPLDLATEGREQAAFAALQKAVDGARAAGGGVIGFVAHPTELVTTGPFWDILNFGAGVNLVPPSGPYRKPELKSQADVSRDLRAFCGILDWIQAQPDLQVIAIDTYQELMPAEHGADLSWAELASRAASGSFPLQTGRMAYSALDALQLLASLCGQAFASGAGGQSSGSNASLHTGPVQIDEPMAQGGLEATLQHWVDAWSGLLRQAKSGILPAVCTVEGRQASVGALLSAFGRVVQAACERYPDADAREAVARVAAQEPDRRWRGDDLDPAVQGLKPVERLHWDWPIFSPGARFDRCYAMTRAQMWTFAPLPDPARGQCATDRRS